MLLATSKEAAKKVAFYEVSASVNNSRNNDMTCVKRLSSSTDSAVAPPASMLTNWLTQPSQSAAKSETKDDNELKDQSKRELEDSLTSETSPMKIKTPKKDSRVDSNSNQKSQSKKSAKNEAATTFDLRRWATSKHKLETATECSEARKVKTDPHEDIASSRNQSLADAEQQDVIVIDDE